MRNVVLALLLLPLLATVQSTLIPHTIWSIGAKPDLVLVAVLAWNLASPQAENILWALIGGLAIDTLSGGPMGATILALLAATVLANFTSERVWASHVFLRMAVAASGSILYYLVYSIVLMFSNWEGYWGNTLINIFLPSIALNTILMLIVFPTTRWIATRISPQSMGI